MEFNEYDNLGPPSVKPLTYEKSIFNRMATDIKSSVEKQLPAIEEIATNAKIQAESSILIAESAKVQADIATKTSKKADIKGWIAVIISLIALFISFITQYETIISFFK